MRIAIPIHSFEPGGVERVALRLAARWEAAGHEVLIILGRDAGRCRQEAPSLDYRAVPEPLPTARWETIWMIWCLFRFLRRERVDVLFCPGNTYAVVCAAMRLLLGRRCPPVLVKISNDLRRADLPPVMRRFYRGWLRIQGALLDHFIALAEPMRPELIAELGVAPERVSVIADPALSESELANPRRDRPRPSAASRHFVSVGRLVPQKNYALLLDAFAHCSLPGDRLTIAGDGPERARLEARIQRLGLADRVALPGHVDQVAQLLAQADVFVLSSDYEGVPAVILEALAAGLPIAATDCCASMGWLLQHGDFGVTAAPRDANALALAMDAARDLDPPRARMATFAAQFTLGAASRKYLFEMESLSRRSPGEAAEKPPRPMRERSGRGV